MKLGNKKETTSLQFDYEKNWFSVETGDVQVTTINCTESGNAVSNLKNNLVLTSSSTNSVDIQSKQVLYILISFLVLFFCYLLHE